MQESTPQGVRISHVGIALAALDDAMPFYREILGLEPVPVSDSDGARIEAFQAGESLVELLESSEPSSPIGKFVAKRGPGSSGAAVPVCPSASPKSTPRSEVRPAFRVDLSVNPRHE